MTSTCSGSPSCVRRRAAPAGWWWGGHDRAGRRVREQLERERRAMHHLAPAPAIARPAQPAPPARHGGVELGGDVGMEYGAGASPGLTRSSTKMAVSPGPGRRSARGRRRHRRSRAARREAEPQLGRAEQRAVRGERDLVAGARSRSAGRRGRRNASARARDHPADHPVATRPLAGTRQGHEILHLPTPSGIRKRVTRMLVSGR